MHAPDWVCKKVEEIHKYARLGWMGRKKRTQDELNPGQFVVLQLYHQRDAAHTMLEHWNDRGPIWGSAYDRLSRVPVLVKAVDPYDVHSGKVCEYIKEWITPIRKRIDECEAEANSKLDGAYSDLSREVVSHMHYRANKTGATRPKPVARKFLSKRDRAILAGDVEPKKARCGLGDVPKEVGKLR